MRAVPGLRARASQGFTLVELVVSSVIFAILSGVLVMGVVSVRGSQTAVARGSARNRLAREATDVLQRELRSSRDDSVEVIVNPDGNSQLDIQTCLEIGGNIAWGAQYEDLSMDPTLQSVPDWEVRYVVEETMVAGTQQRSLMRYVLDAGGVVQDTTTIVNGLSAGDADPPGFEVQRVGDVWSVSLSFEGWTTGSGERMVGFNVKTRS